MHRALPRIILPLLCLAATAASVAAASSGGSGGGSARYGAAGPATLKLATWNLEWLTTPETFRQLRDHCISDDGERRAVQRALPCDVVKKIERGASDFAALARYVDALNADVVAIQEVDGAAAARQVFRHHEFCFSGARALQNNGFAIRRGVPFRCADDYLPLSLGNSVRRGVVVELYPGTAQALWLMSVHLKSGCARGLLDSERAACQKLAIQVAPLEQWIDTAARAGKHFGVLGDFNRELLREHGPARSDVGQQQQIWPEINDGEPAGALLLNVADGYRFRNCASGERHSGYIDQIVLGQRLAAALVPDSFERQVWKAEEAARLTLSDHCPIAIQIRISSRN
jgi:endonuclease/exonuclease/phosphatase family metal-dependent hydrolase